MVTIYGPDGQLVTSHGGGNQYTGSKTDGDLSFWNYYHSDPNNFINRSYGLLSDYCTTLYHTSALARTAVEKPLSYVIGGGLVFRSHIPERILGIGKDEAKEWSRQFTDLLHLYKQAAGYYNLQQELYRESKIVGDSLLFILYDDNEINFRCAGGHTINWQTENLGLVLDDNNNPVGVRVISTNKQNNAVVNFISGTGDLQLLMLKNAARPGQLRGFSCYYSEIAKLKNLDRWWDATLERAVLESVQMAYFSGDSKMPELQTRELARRAHGKPAKDETIKETRLAQRPGSIYTLGNNESLQFTKHETPGNNFGLANQWTWDSFGASVGYPSEFLIGKYNTTFTAHKGALNDAWQKIMQERNNFVLQIEKKINAILLQKFIRDGKLAAYGDLSDRLVLEAHLQGSYLGPVPGHINPKVEVAALTQAVEQGFLLRSDAAARYGSNYLYMLDQWEEEEKRFKNLSLAKQAKILEEAL